MYVNQAGSRSPHRSSLDGPTVSYPDLGDFVGNLPTLSGLASFRIGTDRTHPDACLDKILVNDARRIWIPCCSWNRASCGAPYPKPLMDYEKKVQHKIEQNRCHLLYIFQSII